MSDQYKKEDIKAAFRSIERDQLKSQIDIWEKNSAQSPSRPIVKKRSLTLYIMGLAAAILAIFAVTRLLSEGNDDARSYALSYFEPYPNVSFPINRGGDNTTLLKSMSAYENHQYVAAEAVLDSMCSDGDQPDVCFYAAMSNMKLDQWEQAISQLEKLKEVGSSTLVEKTDWYLAICYIQIDEIAKAKQIISDIVTNGGYNQSSASRLLEEI